MMGPEVRILLLVALAVLPLGALLHLCLRRGKRLIAIGLAMAVVGLPATAHLITMMGNRPPPPPAMVQAAIHEPDMISVSGRTPAFLVRLIEFDFGLSMLPVATTARIALTGEPFRLESAANAEVRWSVKGSIIMPEPAGWPRAVIEWSTAAAETTTTTRISSLLSTHVTRPDGSYLALLGASMAPRAPHFDLLEGGPLSRRFAALFAEPLAEGDQVVEIPFAGWWERGRETTFGLLARSGGPERGPLRPPSRRPGPLVFLVLARCSAMALAVMASGLLLLGTFLRARLAVLALGLVVTVLVAVVCDRAELAHAAAAFDSSRPGQRALAALHAGASRFFPTTATRVLEQAWQGETAPEVQQAIAAALVAGNLTWHGPDDSQGPSKRLLDRIKGRSPLLRATAEAMMWIAGLSGRRH